MDTSPETTRCPKCASIKVERLPDSVAIYDDVIAELLNRGVDLRFAPSLWRLRDAVAASTLQFSMIRMRNAHPRLPASVTCSDVS